MFCHGSKFSRRDTVMIQKAMPSVMALVSPSGERMLGVRTAQYGSFEGIAYTRINASEPEIHIVDETWRVYEVSYDIVQTLVPTGSYFVETPSKIEQIFFAHVGEFRVQLSGRRCGSFIRV